MASVGRRNPAGFRRLEFVLSCRVMEWISPMRLRIAVIAMAAAVGATAVSRAAEQIERGQGETKPHGALFRPAGAGPFPAVVGMHDCDGLGGHSGGIAPWYRDWGERLSGGGGGVGLARRCYTSA